MYLSYNRLALWSAVNMVRFDNANIMLHCKCYYYYYYNMEFECVFLLCLEWDVMY